MSSIDRAPACRKICRLLTALLVAVSLGATVAFAAPALPSGTDNQRARMEDQQRRQREQQKDVFLQKGKQAAKDTSLPDETPAVTIESLILAGDSAARFPWAQAMLDDYAGRKIGAKGIGLIAKRLTDAFIDRGYITTQIALPADLDLSGGTLTLVLVPGRIGAFRFASDGVAGNWRTAFPARPGDILNLRDIEQGLEQMKRLPTQDVTMQIVPGEKPGDSDIVITLRETKRWYLTSIVDDSGISATGKLMISTGLYVDNLFGANDIFTYAVEGDGERKGRLLGTRGDILYYSLPFGRSTLEFTHWDRHYHQTFEVLSLPLRYFQNMESNAFRFTHLLSRDQTSKTNLDAKLIFHRNRSYIEDIELAVQRLNTTAFQLGLSQRRNIGQAVLDVAVANRRGVPWFGAQADPAGSPTTRYSTWLADVGYTTPVTVGKTAGRYSLAFHGEYTRDSLMPTEFVSIGNRFTVRGFDGEQSLAAEYGWYLRSELAVPLNTAGIEAYLGLDCGAVYGPSAQYLPGRFLAGAVVGLRGETKNIRYDIFAGWPLKKPAGFTTAAITYGFQVSYQL